MIGFQEGVKAKFIAQVWDRAGNSITSSVSDSMVIVDQLLPELISLEITSSIASLATSKLKLISSIIFFCDLRNHTTNSNNLILFKH